LSLLARSGETAWLRAFWSVIAKCTEKDLRADLFDLFWTACRGFVEPKIAKSCLEAMNRYSEASSERLAAVLLWSIGVPKVFTWADLDTLAHSGGADLSELQNRLVQATSVRGRPSELDLPLGQLLSSFRPFLRENVADGISRSLRHLGPIQGREGDRAHLIRVIWNNFPEFSLMLVNGLLSADRATRRVCADRIRFVSVYRKEILGLLENLDCIGALADIAAILDDSVRQLKRSLNS
jgi:hypothetical protein